MTDLREITVRNFQSVEDVVLAPGRFTILVGRSNSGKSAIFRALTTLARNASSVKSLVRSGATSLEVEARFGDGVVRVARGEGLSTYVLDVMEPRELVKAGTSVPEDVETFLSLPLAGNGEDIVFATQFDRPFLLDTPSSQVARAVGTLSNVNLLLEASREATRRARNFGNEGRTLRNEAENTAAEAEEEAARAASLRALEEAVAEHVRAAEEALTRAEAVDAARVEASTAARALRDVREKTWPEPDHGAMEAAEELAGRAARLASAADEVRKLADDLRAAKAATAERTEAEASATTAIEAYLATLETCETCGQVIGSGTRLEHAHEEEMA